MLRGPLGALNAAEPSLEESFRLVLGLGRWAVEDGLLPGKGEKLPGALDWGGLDWGGDLAGCILSRIPSRDLSPWIFWDTTPR